MIAESEINRQIFHFLSGIVLVILLFFNIIGVLTLLVILATGIFLSLLSREYKIPIIWPLLHKLERPQHMKTMPGQGALFFLGGALLAVFFFPKDIALASIIILSAGDTVSPIVGKSIGKLRNPLNRKKFLEGTISGIVVAALLASIFVPAAQAWTAAIVAMIVESIEARIYKTTVDDNIIIPFIAGIAIMAFRRFL